MCEKSELANYLTNVRIRFKSSIFT